VRQLISKSIFAKRTAVSRLWSSLLALHEASGKHIYFTAIRKLSHCSSALEKYSSSILTKRLWRLIISSSPKFPDGPHILENGMIYN